MKQKRKKSSLYITFLIILVIFFVPVGVFLIISQKGKDEQNIMTKSEKTESKERKELSIAICDPQNGPFSLTITNPFFPLPVGMVHVLEGNNSKVQFSVLSQTKTLAGVPTRIVEEREWENGEISETSLNYFVQAPDGTVCYFGEDVNEYQHGSIVGHSGSWHAGDGKNKPGIAIPANPEVGQTYQQESAPGVAMDRSEHISMKRTLQTPVGLFTDVLVVKETPASDKQYQRGVGMVFDDGAVLTSY